MVENTKTLMKDMMNSFIHILLFLEMYQMQHIETLDKFKDKIKNIVMRITMNQQLTLLVIVKLKYYMVTITIQHMKTLLVKQLEVIIHCSMIMDNYTMVDSSLKKITNQKLQNNTLLKI